MYKKPKFNKFSFEHKERLWMKADKIDDNFVDGKVANMPISPGMNKTRERRSESVKFLILYIKIIFRATLPLSPLPMVLVFCRARLV